MIGSVIRRESLRGGKCQCNTHDTITSCTSTNMRELEGRFRENRDLQEELDALRGTFSQPKTCLPQPRIRPAQSAEMPCVGKSEIDDLRARNSDLRRQLNGVMGAGAALFGVAFATPDSFIKFLLARKERGVGAAEQVRRKYRKWKARARSLERARREGGEVTPGAFMGEGDITRLEAELSVAKERIREFEEGSRAEKARWATRLDAAKEAEREARDAAQEAERDAASAERELTAMRERVEGLERDTKGLHAMCEEARNDLATLSRQQETVRARKDARDYREALERARQVGSIGSEVGLS